MANRYWVGGTGNWDNASTAHWSTSSGGANSASIPTSADDVFFDANSGGGICTLLTATAVCKSLTCTGFNGTITGTTVGIDVYGNFTLAVGMAWTVITGITFKGSGTLTTAGITILGTINSTGTVTVTLGDNLISTGASVGVGTNGTFNANNFNITCAIFTVNGTTSATILMGTGLWTLTGTGTVWDTSGVTGLNVTGSSSSIKITNSTAANVTFAGGGFIYGNIWFSRGASANDCIITGSNTFADIKDTGTVAHSLRFGQGSNTTFTTFTVSGSAGQLISIDSSGGTGTHTLTCASGIISCDYLNIQHSIATGGATFYAGKNSTNNQAVATAGSGWQFVSYFPVTINDTVTCTDAQQYQIDITVNDTVTSTDDVDVDKSTGWDSPTKNTDSWTFTPKT